MLESKTLSKREMAFRISLRLRASNEEFWGEIFLEKYEDVDDTDMQAIYSILYTDITTEALRKRVVKALYSF